MPVVTLVDTLSIQGYVFATNRLRHAVSGSALVDRLSAWIEASCPLSAIVPPAGGNALLRFSDLDEAKAAMTRLSWQAHREAPGLELAAVHQPFESGNLAEAILHAQRNLQRAKLQRRPGIPLLGLGVTTACVETHLP